MFPPFVIAVYEYPNCLPCETMDFKIIQSLLERVQVCRRCWKTKERAGAGFFSEERQAVELTRDQ